MRRAGLQVADVWDVLQRQREIQKREALERDDLDMENTPDNTFPDALMRRQKNQQSRKSVSRNENPTPPGSK